VLHTQSWGKGDPVVVLHGFTQSGASWRTPTLGLENRHRIVAVDLPGHGGSAAVAADLWESAALVAAAIEAAVGGGPAAVVGYSLGGRTALHLALLRPDLVSRLVLVSATAGMDDDAQRAARRAADDIIAQRVERDGVDVFVEWWLERPLFATLAPEAAGVDSRLGGTAAGLASSLRRAGTGTQSPLWGRLATLEMPVLVVAGALDDRYAALAVRLTAAIGANAGTAIIAGAGHACHLEAPEAWREAVAPFLAGAGPAPGL
jgi:2-succinyl-6-hydroxy-2,4-cyclohexadiene-1-carboxylate synthase